MPEDTPSSERRVHFVYLGGPFVWQHWRAIETAKVHGAEEIVLWYAAEPDDREHWERLDCVLEPMPMGPQDHALLHHPIQLANVKDLLLWRILFASGGLYLDLDTISLQPCWDLLEHDLCVSSEHEPGFDAGHPYNSAVVLGRRDATVLMDLRARAEETLQAGESRWGKCGPHLLTTIVADHPGAVDVAPFGVLNGWRDDTIHRYYEGERPGPDVRVVHLFSSSRPDAFFADRWMP